MHRETTSRMTIVAVIPLYNGSKYIETAVSSVLGQTRQPDEFIVVDDGSTDDGPEIVARLADQYPIRLLRKPNGGQSSARNMGVAESTSSHIAFLDQDDIWYPTHLAELEKAFVTSSEARLGWVYSNLDEIDEAGLLVMFRMLEQFAVSHPKTSVFDCLKDDMFVLPSASLIGRDAFQAVGGFDERLRGYEDDDLFLRLFRHNYANVFLEKPLSKWRIHASSTSYSPVMARSRLIYAKKLFEAFPDDAVRHRFFGRDLIAPRFLRSILGQYLRAVRANDRPGIRATADSLRETIIPNLRLRHRLLFSLLTTPMRSALLARCIYRLSPVFGGLDALRKMARAV